MHNSERSQIRGALLLLAAITGLALLSAAIPGDNGTMSRVTGPMPEISPQNAIVAPGASIQIRSTFGGGMLVSDGMGAPFIAKDATATLEVEPDNVHASRLLAIPLAMQWRHPKHGLPAGRVVRAAAYDAIGRVGPTAVRTFLFQDHGALPVLALVMEPRALFHPDSGIMVVGNAILDADERVAASYSRDPRWWKYPGNFMGRGKEWERSAHLEMITADGVSALTRPIKVRIHGQMTRGFPQHALRLIFETPLKPWGAGVESGQQGHHSMVLRAAGNDQVKAMMRDAFQQRLCEGLPFETSAAYSCVLYINGAYWGVYHLRDRIDHQELARRHGLPVKGITILEDAAVLYRGDQSQVHEFLELIALAEEWDGTDATHMDRLRSALDVDGFLTYMASQMILGNMDWPEQNVKYWKFTGQPSQMPYADGRWYFIMGDSDLGFGANAPASADMYIRVARSNAPVARLFRGLMRSGELEAAFRERTVELLESALSREQLLQGVDSMVAVIGPEMDRHTARWRKPLNKQAWEKEVEVLREFARQREDHVRQQITQRAIPGAL